MLHILAGRERIAFKPWQGKWQVKISRCSQCGKCCEKLVCAYFYEGKCTMPAEWTPFRCVTTEPSKIKECTSKYKEI